MRALVLLVLVSCKGRIESVRDDLAAQRTPSAPACAESACLNDVAAALGSKSGYHEDPPDQASAAAIAVLVYRDGKGSVVGHPDAWITVARASKGPGPDALRAAVTWRLRAVLQTFAHEVTTEDEGRRLLGEIAALPGACGTYVSLAAGKDDASLPLTEQADHAPCVQKDLARRFGPGGTYGFGFWRAVAGALALAKDYADALEQGARLAQIKLPDVTRASLDAIKPKTVEAPAANQWMEHATTPPPLAPDAGRR